MVYIHSSYRRICRTAEQNGPAVPGEQGLVAARVDPPDFVRSIAADVKIAFGIKRQTIRKAAALGRVNIRPAEAPVWFDFEAKDGISVTFDYKEEFFISAKRQAVGIAHRTGQYLSLTIRSESDDKAIVLFPIA